MNNVINFRFLQIILFFNKITLPPWHTLNNTKYCCMCMKIFIFLFFRISITNDFEMCILFSHVCLKCRLNFSFADIVRKIFLHIFAKLLSKSYLKEASELKWCKKRGNNCDLKWEKMEWKRRRAGTEIMLSTVMMRMEKREKKSFYSIAVSCIEYPLIHDMPHKNLEKIFHYWMQCSVAIWMRIWGLV